MKAGIYKTPNGNYVYIAKDRTIKAVTLEPSSWVGNKVRTSEHEQKAHFFDVTAERVADVPNGTIEHDRALQHYIDSLPNPQMLTYAEGARRAIADGTIEDDDEQSLFGEEVKPGDIVIEFRDEGQDFLRWLCRDDLDGLTRVIDSEPYQDWVWNGTIVHNAENLVLGRAELANVTAVGWGTESKEITHVVANAYRVEPSEGPGEEDGDWAEGYDNRKSIGDVDLLVGSSAVGEFKTGEGKGGVSYGAKSFLTNAAQIREAGVAVPPHVARKIVDEYRAEHGGKLVDADFSQLEARVAAMPGDRLLQIMNQDMHAAMWMQQDLAFGYLAEALGFAEVVQDSVYIHDLDKLEELKQHVKAGRYTLAKCTSGYELVDNLPGGPRYPVSFEAATAIHLAAFPKFRYIDSSKLLAIATPVTGPAMHKAFKRHGAKGVVAYTDWEKAVLHKLQAGDIRLCGKQSKRKHRKTGHHVFWFAPLQSWAWEKRA